jgi:hypothetical protein
MGKARAVGAKGIFTAEDILVLDKTGEGFMQQWHNQFDAVKIPHLRSPMFFHPDPLDIDSMVAFSHSNGRQEELMEIHGVVGREVSKHQQKKMRARRKSSTCSTAGGSSGVGLVEVDRRDWKDYYRPGTKLFSDFCQSIIDRYRLHDVVKKEEVIDIKYTEISRMTKKGGQNDKGFVVKTQSGEVYGCKVCILAIGPAGKVNYPVNGLDTQFPQGSCHTTHLFQKQVLFPPQRVREMSEIGKLPAIAIVGGGLTSAQLTELALQRGVNKVHFITRGDIKIKHFDFHLEWVSKYQNYMKSTFWMKDTDEERIQMIEDAREGGSMNPQYHKILMSLVKSGRVVIHKHSEIDRVQWDEENQEWETCTLKNKLTGENSDLKNLQFICYATGTSPSIASQPLMASMINDHPIDIIKGVPCLTDDLQWTSDVPLFVLGRYAMLRTGPSSANLDGGRLGAERIGWYVQDMKAKGRDGLCPGGKGNFAPLGSRTGFEDLLECTGGRCNWYSVLQKVDIEAC